MYLLAAPCSICAPLALDSSGSKLQATKASPEDGFEHAHAAEVAVVVQQRGQVRAAVPDDLRPEARMPGERGGRNHAGYRLTDRLCAMKLSSQESGGRACSDGAVPASESPTCLKTVRQSTLV